MSLPAKKYFCQLRLLIAVPFDSTKTAVTWDIKWPGKPVAFSEAERVLEGDLETFDFGCILAGQSKQVVLKLGNNGKYDFSFRWITKDEKCRGGAGSIRIQPTEGRQED